MGIFFLSSNQASRSFLFQRMILRSSDAIVALIPAYVAGYILCPDGGLRETQASNETLAIDKHDRTVKAIIVREFFVPESLSLRCRWSGRIVATRTRVPSRAPICRLLELTQISPTSTPHPPPSTACDDADGAAMMA